MPCPRTPALALRWLLLLCALLAGALPRPPAVAQAAPLAADPRASSGEWEPVSNWGIFGKHMVLMPSGKVLVWPTGQDARVWDPATNSSAPVPAVFGDLHCAGQAQLADGRVIVIGGQDTTIHNGLNITALFDPFTNSWSEGPPMTYKRWYATATTLADGRLLATSGDAPDGTRSNIPEIYSPASNSWTQVITANKDLWLYPFMYVLPSGKVYAAGTQKATYQLDLASGTWSSGPTNAFGSPSYAESSAMYAPGKIIRSGGGDPAIAKAAIVDMTAAAPQWKQISPMHYPRRRHNLVILADGEVMAVGGTRQADDVGGLVNGAETGAVYEGEIWDPATEQWSVTARMTYDRMYHSTALLLPDGRVLTAGGENSGRLNYQIFKPPYLFKGARPTISQAPSVAAYGSQFSISVGTDGSAISSAALIRPAAVTHAFDHNQRYVPLKFLMNGSTMLLSAPADGNIAPPGYYMLVVKDSKGVPSVASWLRLDSVDNLSPGGVTGTIVDRNTSAPVASAAISYSGGATTSDATGVYTLTNVLPGEQHFSVAGSGYAGQSQSLLVTGKITSTLDFALAPPATLSGTIRDSQSNSPIVGAFISAQGGSATTDAAGQYTLADIPSGSQTLDITAPGYESLANQPIELPEHAALGQDFALAPKPSFIVGEIRDHITKQTLAGATVSAGAVTTSTDALGRYQLFVPPGGYTLTVALDGYTPTEREALVTFGAYTSADVEISPLNPPLSFLPVADAYVALDAPAKNYGSSTTLRLDSGSTTENSYLRFAVSGASRKVESATLRLYVATNNGNGGSDSGGSVYTAENNAPGSSSPWTESGITYSSAPAIGAAQLASAGAVAEETWVEFDVTPAVSGNGTVVFGLRAGSTDEVRYSSKEGGHPPQLLVQLAPPAPPPTIDGFAPLSGMAGETITIIGSDFADATAVTFNGIAASSFTLDSDSQIRAVVPPGATTGAISVSTGAGSGSSTDLFSVLAPPAPQLSSFTPTHGPIGTLVTIAGASFDALSSVKFNGVAASSLTVDSATQIRAVVPAGASSGTISVTTGGGSASSTSSFNVTTPAPPPSIGSFAPISGPAGTEVTIHGSGFVDVTGVSFNQRPASSFTLDSATQIRAVVPAGASSGAISITTASGSAASVSSFSITSAPSSAPQRVFLPLISTAGGAGAALRRDGVVAAAYLCLLGGR